ncbi:hypothetical protein CISG_09304 [Coccidioides immitis RMSCC 3703]|uniref:Uncharacterized protein n=1 Tax=Coccidioides immitis RMSCC 3703 TaxID=454286 RepID=A0A0J8U409_COCIT|nr:hypothetical protein CISG_09304 [Coccidioides immitis RMSCC 3703]
MADAAARARSRDMPEQLLRRQDENEEGGVPRSRTLCTRHRESRHDTTSRSRGSSSHNSISSLTAKPVALLRRMATGESDTSGPMLRVNVDSSSSSRSGSHSDSSNRSRSHGHSQGKQRQHHREKSSGFEEERRRRKDSMAEPSRARRDHREPREHREQNHRSRKEIERQPRPSRRDSHAYYDERERRRERRSSRRYEEEPSRGFRLRDKIRENLKAVIAAA